MPTATESPVVLLCQQHYKDRRHRLLGFLEEEAHQSGYPSLYGSAEIGLLATGREVAKANSGLRRVTEWFDHPHPKGRDRRGECDFAAIKLCRAFHLFNQGEVLEESTRQGIKQFFLTQDYCSIYGSENHVLIFHVSRYLMAQVYREDYFEAYAGNGTKFHAEDGEWLKQFIRYRAQCGWGEFDSACYLVPDWECMACLYDFAADEELRRLAGMMMNLMLADMVVDSLDGMYGGAHGRIYPAHALDHAAESTYALQYLYFGAGNPSGSGSLHVIDALTCAYRPHPVLIAIALDRHGAYENRERKHLHNMDDSLPAVALEASIRKYTYWTPRYVMGCVQQQDRYPSHVSNWYAHHQQHQWDLTFGGDTRARIFSHHPGNDGEHNYWTGDRGCGCGHFFQHKTVLVALYKICGDQPHQYIHLNVPKFAFDEVSEENGALFVRKGDSYAMLAILPGYRWTTEGEWKDREIVSDGPRHAVVCEAGSSVEFGNYETFRRETSANKITFNAEKMELEYRSKRAGTLAMDTQGGRRLNGQAADLDYPTYGSPYMKSEWKTGRVELIHGKDRLVLDFSVEAEG